MKGEEVSARLEGGDESQKGEQQREMRTDTDGRRAGRDVRVGSPGRGAAAEAGGLGEHREGRKRLRLIPQPKGGDLRCMGRGREGTS